MKIIVIGGAGYIGSVCVKRLIEENHEVLVFDNLSKGRLKLVDKKAKFIRGDILDEDKLNEVFSNYKFDAVFHFAALKDAGESMKEPQKYSKNIIGTINLLNIMSKHKVSKIIFSSSAAVYGNSKEKLIDENHKTEPLNFYGFTKLESEKFLEWYSKLCGIEYISLRYFNVAGDGGLNYIDPNAKNIFPIIAEVVYGIREKLLVYGSDYETLDGTGIRDYIHVIDLVEGHIKALNIKGSQIINLGNSRGYSVLELIKSFEKNSQKKINYELVERREGDPAFLLASCQKAKKILNWEAKYDLDEMVLSTLKAYELNNPK